MVAYIDLKLKKKKDKKIEKETGFTIIRINPDKENFDIFAEIGKIQKYIVESIKKITKESTKKSIVDELSNKLLRLEFKSNNSIKTKCLKYAVKKILPTL